MEGITYGDIQDMPSEERVWYINRLHKQSKMEDKEIKDAARGKGK